MHLVLDGNSAGPFTMEQVRAMWAEGRINVQTLFFREGMTDWQPLSQIQHELVALSTGPVSFAPVLIPGFWRRFGGMFIDMVLLGIVGFLLATPLFDFFVSLGQWGKLVGFVIAGAYFVILDSSIGGGMTIGKRLLGLQVVGANGELISPGKSLLRYLVWAVPYFLNGVVIGQFFSAATLAVQAIVIIALVSIGYLLIFNRRTRQNIHDLATNTYIVRKDSAAPASAGPVWKGHFAFIGVILALFLGTAAAGGYVLFRALDLDKMLVVQEKVMTLPDVQLASINAGTNYSYVNGQSSVTHVVSVSANFGHPIPDVDKAARSVAAVVLTDPSMSQTDVISITVKRAYNIGIASGSWTQGISHRPEEWQKEIDSAGK